MPLLLILLAFLAVPAFCAMTLPGPAVPDGLGVNIHFTGAPARDLDMLQAGGFRFIRMDFAWGGIEKTKGTYDFAAYDKLTDALAQRGIRPLYILDYSNTLYEKEWNSVRTEDGCLAFARFAAAAAEHYKGRGVIWELWNEPNISQFWRPNPNVDEYMALAKATLPAIRKADPDAFIVAPATSQIDLIFLEACFRQGLLQLVDAVTVHPYRQTPPESVIDEYLRLRALIARYCPEKANLPVISGEWGFSAIWTNFDAAKQGMYLPREYLVNLSQGIPLSIWYDWHDDGQSATDPECNFGTVNFEYQPKAAYLAMQKLVAALKGLHFVKRLQSKPEDYLLFFSDGKKHVIAAWTTGNAHEIDLFPNQKTTLTGDPQYLPVPADAEAVLAEGAWSLQANSVGIIAGAQPSKLPPAFTITLINPFPRRVTAAAKVLSADGISGKFLDAGTYTLAPGQQKVVRWQAIQAMRNDGISTISVQVTFAGYNSAGRAQFIPINPLPVSLMPTRDGRSGMLLRTVDEFTGSLKIQMGAGVVSQVPLSKLSKQKFSDGWLYDLPKEIEGKQPLRLVLYEKDVSVADSGLLHLQPLPLTTDALRAFKDGDLKVPQSYEVQHVTFPEPEAPLAEGLRLNYEMTEGWAFVRIAPEKEMPVEGKPKAIGVWVKGDNSGTLLIARFSDQNGRMYQPHFGKLDFTGWRYMTAPLNDPKVYGWGGTPDVADIAYPIRLNTVLLLDASRKPRKGVIDFAGLHLIYQEK